MNDNMRMYSNALRLGLEDNLEIISKDVELLDMAYKNEELDGVEIQLQRIVKGASTTLSLITPLMMVEDEELMSEFMDGGRDDEGMD